MKKRKNTSNNPNTEFTDKLFKEGIEKNDKVSVSVTEYNKQLDCKVRKENNKGREPDILGKADDFLQSTRLTNENVNIINELFKVHRQLEDTKARHRLELWCKLVIGIYLGFIAVLLSLSYCSLFRLFKIPDNVMITILTTMTINVIGLLAIVLRGHFSHDKVILREINK